MKERFRCKKNILPFLSFILLFSFSGCDWFSSSPENSGPKLHWKTKIYTNGGVDGRFPNVLYNDKIFITMAQVAEYETKLVGLDIETGKQLWEWNDSYIEKEAGDFRSYALFNKKLVFALGGRHYCINAETGKTAWRNRVNSSSSSVIVQLENKYFYSGSYYDSNPHQVAIFMGNIETGEITEIYKAEPEVMMKAPAVFLSDEGDIMLAIGESRTLDQTKYLLSQTYVLYNVTKNIKVYSVLASTTTYNTFGFRENIIWDNKLYSDIGHGLICLDLKTGAKIWEKSTSGDFLFSNFIVNDGFLYANCENGYRYKLDANTGFVKWQELNTGTCTPIFMMNGVLYYIGGGDGKLYAVDAVSGSIIYKVENPDDRSNGFMPSTPYVLNGRVYCSGFYYAYCFEAAR